MHFSLSVAVFLSLKFHTAFSCAGGGTGNNQIYQNPSFTLQFNPPTAWTYPNDNALATASYFPGQPLTQVEANNNALGATKAAMLQALSEVGFNTAVITVTAQYTAPQVSDCVKVTAGSISNTAIGQVVGWEEAGAITRLGTVGVAVSLAQCAGHDYSMAMMTYQPFVQQASIKVDGLTASGYQLQQVSNSLMTLLNFNNRVIFTEEVTYA